MPRRLWSRVENHESLWVKGAGSVIDPYHVLCIIKFDRRILGIISQNHGLEAFLGGLEGSATRARFPTVGGNPAVSPG
jgi:hypothetical protein